MPNYLVTDELFNRLMIINHENEEGAKQIFYKKVKIEEDFIEELYVKSINLSFWEKFWHPLIGNYKKSFEEIKKLEPQFLENIRKFCGEKKEYADLMINYWLNVNMDENYTFPDDLIDFVWRKTISSSNYFGLKVINLDAIQYYDESDF